MSNRFQRSKDRSSLILARNKPSVSVIVLNYNGLELSTTCLEYLLKTKYSNFNIYFVDNGSDLDEAKILQSEFADKKIRFIRNKKNLGFVVGNNIAVKKVSSKYVVFLNNDTQVDANWLSGLVEEMESNKKLGACQPKILSLVKSGEFDYGGACGGFIDKYGYPFTRGRVFYTSEKDRGQYDKKINVFWASGVALMVNRKNFIKSGMFDRDLFIYMEEIDLCWRLQNLGYTVSVVPSSVIYHINSATAKKNMIKKRFYEHRNNLILLVKYYSSKDLLLLFPQRIIMEFLSLFYFLIKRDLDSFIGQAWGDLAFLFLLPKLFKKRGGEFHSMSNFNDGVYKGSIVLKYFIFGKKNFAQVFK